MRIVDFLEELSLDRKNITEELEKKIANLYTDEEWIKATNILLNGLEQRHNIPGNIVYELTDMCYRYKQEPFKLTYKQRFFVSTRLVLHWDQLTLIARLKLYPY